MMKKMHFLVACCLVVCLALGGCAREELPLEAPAETDASPEMPAEPEERPAEPEVPVEAPVEAEETPAEEIQENEELHGIMALVSTPSLTFNIIQISPETGDIKNLATFTMPNKVNGDGHGYINLASVSHYANCQEVFSPDFSKMATIQVDEKTGDTHAGWIETDGTFFDITAILYPALGSGFSDSASHAGIGFTSDGRFIYSDNGFKEGALYYSVPVDNISLDAVEPFSWKDTVNSKNSSPEIGITDWIDETRHLVDYQYWGLTSKIYDSATGEFIDYIPDGERYNWGAVADPSGQKIAFLSKPNNAVGIELYVTSPNGGEPIQVNMTQTLNDVYGKMESRLSPVLPWCTLLDWK